MCRLHSHIDPCSTINKESVGQQHHHVEEKRKEDKSERCVVNTTQELSIRNALWKHSNLWCAVVIPGRLFQVVRPSRDRTVAVAPNG